MAEALALAASIIAVIQITDRVVTLCHQFVGKVRGADKQIFQMINTITAIKGVLEFLKTFVDNGDNKSRLPLLYSLCKPNGSLERSRTALADIESKLQLKKRDHTKALKAITWPWIWKDIGPVLEDIEKHKTLMLLAMQRDMTQMVQRIEDTVTNIHCTKIIEKRMKILKWISAANYSSRHEAVSKERAENSGTWFLQSEAYQSWLNGNTSNLLCYEGIRRPLDICGLIIIAGAGKTFLT